MSIAETFDDIAREYDEQRKLLIPCFDEFYGVAVRLLHILHKKQFKVLDLGTGTGLLAALVLESFPGVEITGIDISARMLNEFEMRFNGRNVEFRQADYIHDDLGSGYDAVISSLSIHHLTAEEKAGLFRKIHAALNDGGIFINADQVLGETDSIEIEYRRDWYEQMAAAGVSAEILSAAEERMKEDKMSTLADQLQWVRDAGFSDVNCWYKNFIFSVYGGRKIH